MIRTFTAAGLFLALLAAPAFADPIEGNWKTKSGETAAIAACGGAFCVTLKTGTHAGKRIGKMSGRNGKYSGEITDPKNDKTYTGDASLSGNTLKMRGCVLKVLCRSENWSRI